MISISFASWMIPLLFCIVANYFIYRGVKAEEGEYFSDLALIAGIISAIAINSFVWLVYLLLTIYVL